MGKIIEIETTRCLGHNKADWRKVYFALFPDKTEQQFEAAWEQYKQDKAEHIRKLNEGS